MPKDVQYIDGDMPPLAETGKPGLLPTDQTVGAPAGSGDYQIYAAGKPDTVGSGTIPVDAQDLPGQRFSVWAGKAWVKWGLIGLATGAVGRFGYQKWKR